MGVAGFLSIAKLTPDLKLTDYVVSTVVALSIQQALSLFLSFAVVVFLPHH
tara:strand:- start:63 stop:215 length:153 start_codon:yes stop_codon:yes gene_type:complete